nr:efflux RND transporter periplasmic adaptor subunit [uncultured Anaeromusa sp.]
MNLFRRYTVLVEKKRYYCGLAVVLCLCAVSAFYWKEHSQAKTATEEALLVRAGRVAAVGSKQNYVYSGEVRGRFESQLSFQVGGKLIKRYVELGSIVHAGDALMQIDSRDLQQVVNSNVAATYSAESQLKLAENNLNRYQQLYSQGAISQAQLDQYQSAYEVARASAVQAGAQYSQGANQLGYSVLYADKDGVVSNINAEVGQVVGAGQAVVTLVQDGEREVEINVPENRVEELRKATQSKITFWALGDIATEGRVREISPMADPVTRTYKARLTLLNAPPEVKLGMTAAVEISDSQNGTVKALVPLSSIYQTNNSPCVWVVKEGVVQLRPVQTGAFRDASIEILSGVENGEVIVTAGVHRLREGQKVKISGGTKA